MTSVEKIILQSLRDQEIGSELTQHEWIYKEAIDMKSLQKAGTFRNALLRKLDQLITGIFAEIIAYVNRYDNLLVLTESGKLHLQYLWFDIFTSEHLCQRTILKASSSPRSEFSSVQSVDDHYFTCQFPFSWAIFSAIKSALQNSGKIIVF